MTEKILVEADEQKLKDLIERAIAHEEPFPDPKGDGKILLQVQKPDYDYKTSNGFDVVPEND